MKSAGLFAGDVTGSAPAPNSTTYKKKGYIWFEVNGGPPKVKDDIPPAIVKGK